VLERTLTIVNRLGLHARAAAKLTRLASSFEARVTLAYRGREINAKSIMGLMLLAAARGADVILRCDGADEAAAVDAIAALVADRFGEGE
jgi:phosphocarrier protein HPr